jgi:hypothetical protein
VDVSLRQAVESVRAIIQSGTYTVLYNTAAITFAGVMISFKIWSVILIYIYGSGDGITNFLLGTHVLWFGIPLLFVWGPLLFWTRLLRMRRRRQMLLEAEWHLERHPSQRR